MFINTGALSGWGYNSVVEYSRSIHIALTSIPRAEKKRKRKEEIGALSCERFNRSLRYDSIYSWGGFVKLEKLTVHIYIREYLQPMGNYGERNQRAQMGMGCTACA